MRQFIWPILLLALGAPEIEKAVMDNLNRNFPIEQAQYVCDLSRLDLSRVPDSDSVAVDGFGKEAPKGQTVVRLSFYNEGRRVYQTAVSIRIGILKPVLVSSGPLKAGEAITNFKIETRDVASIDETPFELPEQLNGLVAAYFIPAGRAIVPSAVKAPPTVKSGCAVRIRVSRGVLSLDTGGVARENGTIGSRIKVMNVDSRKIISAVVIDSTTVAIREGDRF